MALGQFYGAVAGRSETELSGRDQDEYVAMADKNFIPILRNSNYNDGSFHEKIDAGARSQIARPRLKGTRMLGSVTKHPNDDRHKATTPRVLSERKLLANRANARKSKGPRTARGKSWSRRNAVRHGLTSRVILFDSQAGVVSPELQAFLESLRQKSSRGQPQADPTVDSVVLEYAHQHMAAKIEARVFQKDVDDATANATLRKVLRYRIASQRTLLKNIARLQVQPEKEG